MDFIMSSESINKIIAYSWVYTIPYSATYTGGRGGAPIGVCLSWKCSSSVSERVYVCVCVHTHTLFHLRSPVQSVLEAVDEEWCLPLTEECSFASTCCE